MVDIKNKRCIHGGCNKRPNFNLSTETKAIYCSEHKKENMVNIRDKQCIHDGCNKYPVFNLSTETKAIYCFEHKKENMVNIKSKKCQTKKCKNDSIYGFINKRKQYCYEHKEPDMVNLVLENKCSILDCGNEYEFTIDGEKMCLTHAPEEYETNIKKLCKFCDIKEHSKHICNRCEKVQNKKEWAVVRYLRKTVDTKFEYNSSKMLQGCSKKRPDVYFELDKHCVIVEIDEHQHRSYEDSCECARICEIVSGIGGKSVIFIRFNPDTTKHKDKRLNLELSDKIDLLVDTIKNELVKKYDTFVVKQIQLYYNDDYDVYQPTKEENITDKVCV